MISCKWAFSLADEFILIFCLRIQTRNKGGSSLWICNDVEIVPFYVCVTAIVYFFWHRLFNKICCKLILQLDQREKKSKKTPHIHWEKKLCTPWLLKKFDILEFLFKMTSEMNFGEITEETYFMPKWSSNYVETSIWHVKVLKWHQYKQNVVYHTLMY